MPQVWPNPTICAASQETSSLTGPTGVKMSGPYAWTSPYYWYVAMSLSKRVCRPAFDRLSSRTYRGPAQTVHTVTFNTPGMFSCSTAYRMRDAYWSVCCRLEGADKQLLGGAFGFLTEGGPGGSPLTYESWSWTVPAADLWPQNAYWDFHCANPEVCA